MNEQAKDPLEYVIQQMKEIEGVTEQLKVGNQMQGVGTMNNIRNRAEEIVLKELIYTVE